ARPRESRASAPCDTAGRHAGACSPADTRGRQMTDTTGMSADDARARFEELIPQIRNQEIVDECAMLLVAIVRKGGVITERDWQRLYGHLDTFEAQMTALTRDVLLYDVRSFASKRAREIVARRGA